jgi:hypothetical protein
VGEVAKNCAGKLGEVRASLLCAFDGDNRNACGVGAIENVDAIKEEGVAGFDGETGGTCVDHIFDGGEADDGNVEAEVLIGLGDFDDGEAAGQN